MGHANRILEQKSILEDYQCDECETIHATKQEARECCEGTKGGEQ